MILTKAPTPAPHPVSSSASTPCTSGSLRTTRRLLALLPLLWAASAGSPALAVELIYQGPPGSSGLTGTTPGASGTAGTSGSAAVRSVSSGDTANLVDITGGSGGHGGHGADGNPGQQGGNGGAGGSGGASDASLTLNVPASGATARLNSTGGAGGNGGLPGFGDLIGQSAAGGNGGNASANSVSVINSGTLNLTQAATGGAGGSTLFSLGGSGGNASSVANVLFGSAVSVTLDSTATGGEGGAAAGDPNTGILPGAGGAGGAASSTVTLITLPFTTPAADSWNAVMNASSTALAGAPGLSAFTPDGGSADATINISGYGRVSGTALARGGYGAGAGGIANANAQVSSSYSAVASADAVAGGARFTAGAGGTALARASSAYHAQATAIAESGAGRAGGRDAPLATAEAVVNRVSGTLLPPAPSMPAEARAFAAAGAFGGQALARSTYRDTMRGAAVIATASGQPSQLYSPEASSAANVGGPAYGPWTVASGVTRVTSYASALPDTSSLAPLLAQAPTVNAALAGADVLGAGTVGALFFPFTASASFDVPFTSGRHLLLGFVQPFTSDFPGATFEFSVQQGGTTLYTGSFSDPAQYTSFFNDKVLDLGVITSSSLDLLLTFSLSQGLYGFSYVLAAGDAVTPVPEPTTWLMLVLGLALLTWQAKVRRPMCNPAQQLQ